MSAQLPATTSTSVPQKLATKLASIRTRAKRLERQSRALARETAQFEEELAKHGIRLVIVEDPDE